jgi:hypothetical protein
LCDIRCIHLIVVINDSVIPSHRMATINSRSSITAATDTWKRSLNGAPASNGNGVNAYGAASTLSQSLSPLHSQRQRSQRGGNDVDNDLRTLEHDVTRVRQSINQLGCFM